MVAERVLVRLREGAIAGAVAWTTGYLLAYVVAIDRIRNEVAIRVLQLFLEEATDWTLVGWAFYNAHGVDVVVPRVAVFGPARVNYLESGEPAFRLLYLLPPTALVLAGTAAARSGRVDDRTRVGAVVDGASIVAGYLPFSVAGAALFAIHVGDGVIRPDPVAAVLLAGVAYPVAFGAIGGVLANALAERGRSSPEP